MAESRRVQLTTLARRDAPCVARREKERAAGAGAGVGAGVGAGPDTVRLVLGLFESDERRFPEFSYAQLMDTEVGHPNEGEGPPSRFEEEEKQENEEMAEVARKLEEKYGGRPKKKKKKDRIQDLIDIGDGYDDEDSFIDNSEAYDEFVPSSITTKFGGFYVNSGVLQFREASDSETDERATEERTPEPNERRRLEDKPRKRRCRAGGDGVNNMDAKSSTSSEVGADDEIMRRRKKKVAATLSVTSMLKKFQREKEQEQQRMARANQRTAAVAGAPSFPLFPADAAGGGGSGLADPLLSLIGSTDDHALIQAASAVDFDIDLDSLLDASEETASPKSAPEPATETQLPQPGADLQTPNSFSSAAQPESRKAGHLPRPPPEQILLPPEAKSTSPHQCVPLPEGLPPDLEDGIKKLMAAAKTSEGESKLKFFTPEINSLLLDIEFRCREQGGQLRSKVFTHLSSFLPCSRETLLKRVKRLLLTHAEDPPTVDDPMQKLKEAIGRAMPDQVACFHESCRAYEQVKALKATEEKKDGKQKVNDDNVEEKGGKRGGPRKLFKWNEEIRECLCVVLRENMDRYKREGRGSHGMEEHLKAFLDNDVKPLWPKGWMQSRVLLREGRKALGLFASLLAKKTKPEKKSSSISDAATVSRRSFLQAGTPSQKGEPSQETDWKVTESSFVSSFMLFGDAADEGKTGEGVVLDAGPSATAEANQPLVSMAPAPQRASLDQESTREGPLSVYPELLAAAVAKYKRSVQRWSLFSDTKSPPFPPPPPQSSPVDFPEGRLCQVVLPRMLQDLTGHEDQGQMISDDDVVIQ